MALDTFFYGVNPVLAAGSFHEACHRDPAIQSVLAQPPREPDLAAARDSATIARMAVSHEEQGEMEAPAEDGPYVLIEVLSSQTEALNELLTVIA